LNTPSQPHPSSYYIQDYWDIVTGLILGLVAYIFHTTGYGMYATIASALAIASLSVTVSEVADILAERLGEPYGSFVLTFSAVAVEILLLFMILLQAFSSNGALETVKGGIISAVIVDMNVLLGLAVFIGGLAFKEQQHNEDTSSSYTTILLVTASALLVPSMLSIMNDDQESLKRASILIAGLLFLFYIVLYIFQTKTHSHFFKATARSRIFRIKRRKQLEDGDEDIEEFEHYIFDRLPNSFNFIAIFALILFIGLFAEIFASDGIVIFKQSGISIGLAGLIIAIISVSPEIFTAIKAAKNDQIQRVVNIAMGASTVSILLTVPILMALSYANGIELTLDFNSLQIGALLLTIILAWKTTDDGQTNYFEGISHLMFFLSYAIIAAFY
jgi:Ca2+:H+ antiporter